MATFLFSHYFKCEIISLNAHIFMLKNVTAELLCYVEAWYEWCLHREISGFSSCSLN